MIQTNDVPVDRFWYRRVFHPNVISAARLFALPFVIREHLAGHNWSALVLFIPAAATDILDGYLARRWKMTSEKGAFIDQLVDKLFFLPLFFVLLVWPRSVALHNPPQPLWFVLLFAIELGLVLSRTKWFDRFRAQISHAAKHIGKVKTWVQAIAVGLFLTDHPWCESKGEVFFYLSIVLAIGSFSSRIRIPVLSRRR